MNRIRGCAPGADYGAVCHREEETYPIVYRAEVWGSAFVRVSGLRQRSRRRAASCEHGLTAMFSDMFEANGLSIAPEHGASRATLPRVGVDNESDQVP